MCGLWWNAEAFRNDMGAFKSKKKIALHKLNAHDYSLKLKHRNFYSNGYLHKSNDLFVHTNLIGQLYILYN